MKKIVHGAAISILIFVSHLVYAVSECKDGCKITSVQPYSGSPGTLIYVSGGTWSANEVCGSSNAERRFIVNASDPLSNELVSVALASFASGTDVHIKGNGQCPYYTIEEVLFIKAMK